MHSRIESGGYACIRDVFHSNPEYTDEMPSYWLSETLKYLWLLFQEDRSDQYLHEWVFNTEGHPLPQFSKLRNKCVA